MDAASFDALAFYILLSVVAVAGLIWLSSKLGERHRPGSPADLPFESGIVSVGDAPLRFPITFYLVAMFFVLFDLEAVFLFAWAVVVRQAGWQGFTEALVFVVILLAALAYLWRDGGLDWAPRRDRGVGG